MSQHDFSIANQTASSARTDINNALQALASNNSGVGAPTTTYANMLWYETDTNTLHMRNEDNTAWLTVAYINQSVGLGIRDNTRVVDYYGTQVGLLGDQSTATWQAGTGTTESLVSPAKVSAAINNLVVDDAIGVGQRWKAHTSRAAWTWYYNNSPKGIMVQAYTANGPDMYVGPSSTDYVIISQSDRDGDLDNPMYVIVPAYNYWLVTGVDHVSSSRYQNILDN